MPSAIRKTLLLLRLALVCVALVFSQAPAQAAPHQDTVVCVAAGGEPDSPDSENARVTAGHPAAVTPRPFRNDSTLLRSAQPRASPRLYLRHHALLR